MSLAYWIKESKNEVNHYIKDDISAWLIPSPKRRQKKIIFLRVLSLIFISVGLALATNALWPMISYKILWESEINQTNKTLIPLESLRYSKNQQPLTSEVQAIEIEKDPDLNLVNWFPQGMPKLPEKEYRVMSYLLSIPKLGIRDVKVTIDGQDLSKSLIQYKGTSVPGDLGQPVIFGHSNLPQFYSPKNYKTIFTQLPKLKIGDLIEIDYDGVRYTYQVINLKVVKPDNFTILEQYYNYRGLRLVTCVPPGTTWERLVVEAKLVD